MHEITTTMEINAPRASFVLCQTRSCDVWGASCFQVFSTASTSSKIEPLDQGRRTRFIQGERFTGLLVPLLRKNLDRGTREGFEAMNQALKARVEAYGFGRFGSAPALRESVPRGRPRLRRHLSSSGTNGSQS